MRRCSMRWRLSGSARRWGTQSAASLSRTASARYVLSMFGIPPPPIPADKRSIMREVALTYRRVGRAAKAAGLSPPEYQSRAVEAALAAYWRLDPDAPQ